jgi:putative ABC transport system substrate-binding protein
VIAATHNDRAQALLVLPDSIFSAEMESIARSALAHRLPATYVQNRYAEVGGLMSYGRDNVDNWWLGAAVIDKILKGARPGDLPFEQPSTFQLVINAKTARTLGVKIPQALLLRATTVIQ